MNVSEIIRVSWNDRFRQNTETERKIVKPLRKKKGKENNIILLLSLVKSFIVFESHN